MAKEDLSKAELYRQERKERLAKEAKKNAKMNAKVSKVKKIILKTVAVVAALAIVCSIVVGIVNNTGSTVFKSTAFKVGSYDVSSTEFQYYYQQNYAKLKEYASNIDSQYGTGTAAQQMGFDSLVSPDEQDFPNNESETTTAAETTTAGVESTTVEETTTEKAPSYKTWNDYLIDSTYTSLQNIVALAAEAEKAKVSLDKSEIKDIDDQIEQLRTSASSNSYTLNAYLRTAYGKGVNEKLFRKFMLRDKLAEKYADVKKEELSKSYSANEIASEYKKNLTTYAFTDLRLYQIKVETPTLADDATDKEKAAAQTKAIAAAKKKADAFLKVAKDEKSFKAEAARLTKLAASEDDTSTTTSDEEATTTDSTLQKLADYATIKSNVSEDAANWIFDSSRKIGDTKILTAGTGDAITAYYVTYIAKPVYKDTSNRVSVRHILFKFDDDATDADKAKDKSEAEAALKEWKAGEATEDSFATLAESKSEDTGSSSNGGLYENIYQGQMVTTFNDWSFDKNRKAGDTGIVETEYGYHVMYFVGKNSYPYWEKQVRDALSTTDYENYTTALADGNTYKIEKHEGLFFRSLNKSIIKTIKRAIYTTKANSTTAATYS